MEDEMMRVIETYYIGPSNTRGPRVKATTRDGNQITISWVSQWSVAENHKRAAKRLRDKMGGTGRFVGGFTKRGMVWVDTYGGYEIPANKMKG